MRKEILVVQGAAVEEALRRAVRDALIMHKRAGNSIAAWDGEKVIIVPADEITIDQWDGARRSDQREA